MPSSGRNFLNKIVDVEVLPAFKGGVQLHTPRISDSLRAVCGTVSDLVARIDHFPHSEFLSKPRTIQHLIGMTLSRRGADLDRARAVMSMCRFNEAVEVAMGKRMEGLEKIFSKSRPILFEIETYRKLVELISCRAAMKVLGHADETSADLITILHALPAELRRAGLIKHIMTAAEASVVALAASPDNNPDGHISRSMLARRLASTGTREAFWQVIEGEMFSRMIFAPKAPEVDDFRITPVEDIRQLIMWGKKLRNCLRTLCPELGGGDFVYYIFDSGEHQAVISVAPHFSYAGVIDEIGGFQNNSVPEYVEKEIIAIFGRVGIVPRDKTTTSRFNDIHFAFNRLRGGSKSSLVLTKFSNDIIKLVHNEQVDEEDEGGA